MGRFLEKLETGEDVMGAGDSLGGVPMADVLAEAGMDFACLDTMFSPFDWGHAQAWARAALLRGMDPMIRLPAFPWMDQPDTHAFAEAARAFGIGMNGVCLSVNTPSEVANLVEISHTWHKNIHLHPFSQRTFKQYVVENAGQNVLVPLIESEESIRQVDEIFAVEGLRAVWLGLSDLSRMFGEAFDYEHPRVWEFVDHAAELGKKYNVLICGNPGYEFCRDMGALKERIVRMREHGIRGIWLQNSGFLVQWMYRDIAQNIPDYAK